MTAIVKDISVHPKFKYHRRSGIFDDLDRRESLNKRKQQKSARAQTEVSRASVRFNTDFNFYKTSSPVSYPTEEK